ncbi:MAG TPA: Calx-beta domain-containing protein [Allosphingosinicella sp.]|jgi:predicted extracellular nuclease/Ca2+-binding RTX toxin-like protein|nr:Calx-beta domain-containing protein [Allosphingosinicella sp.]
MFRTNHRLSYINSILDNASGTLLTDHWGTFTNPGRFAVGAARPEPTAFTPLDSDPGPATDAVPTAGTIAFTGFNADDPDSLAFAALDDLAPGTVIIFDDNEWNGTAFNTGEGTLTLTLTNAVAAGTIIRIDSSNTATPTTSHGTIVRSGSFDLSGTTESVYAYTGTSAVPTFLAALGISGFTGATTTGLLTNTGLTLGATAIDIGVIDAGADIAAYDAARSGQLSFAAYASIINNTANWVTQDAAGSQANDGTNPDTPFSAVAFTLASPGSLAINDVSHAEGNAGPTAYSFTVTRSGGSTGAVGATWTLVAPGGAGLADAGDFDVAQLFTGSVAFADGQTSQTITINVNGDLTVEDLETFNLVLSAATGGATIADATGLGTITNDDVAAVPGQLSIGDVTLAEGDSGTTAFTFTVTRSLGDDGAVSATWTLDAPGGANLADSVDFAPGQPTSGTVSFADGETSQTITILVQGDVLVETDETFLVTLSAPTGGASLGNANGTGAITNDDAAGSLSIGDRTLAEGDSGTTAFSFTVTRSGGSDGAVGASWTLDAPGGANLADLIDFASGQPTSGTISFADGETSQTITILVQGDVTFEDTETFLVTLSAPTGGVALGNANGTGTITNDDPAPAGTLSVDDVSHSEGDTGSTTTFTFTVTRSAGTAGAITADWTISAPGGAGNASTSDFVGGSIFSGQVAFADGETSRTISIDVQGDVVFEADETFTVTLSNVTGGGGIGDGTGTGTIVNDDIAPPAGSVSIADVSIVEGNAGTSILTLTLTRIGGTAAFDVNYATSNGGIPGHASATAGSDYVAASGLVSFADGQNTATIQITINGDTTPELSEEFTVTLSGATNGATLSDATAIATIATDDVPPASTRIFDEDFTGFTAGGFAPNPTATQIDSDIWRVVGLSDIANPAYGFTATTGDFARGTIGSNDPTTAGVYSPTSNPALVLQPTGAELDVNGFIEARIENTSGSTATGFDIAFDWAYRNSGDRASSLTFSYSTDGINFTAVPAAAFSTPSTAGAATNIFALQNELVSLSGLSVAAGQFVYLRWTHVSSAGSGNRDEFGIDNVTVDATGGATGPLVSVSDVSVNEAAGTMTFTVTRANAAAGAFTVAYATADGTALAGSDYTATSGTLSFADNQTSATVTVAINNEGIPELDETLFLNLSNATGATIADGQGVGTIVNDDGTPIQVSINDVSIVEGQSGTSVLTFTVTRTGGTGAFDVNFETTDGSAVAPGDYLANSGTLSFGVGQNSQTISITINGDLITESNETFQVLLSGATNNAIIADGAGTGTIVNDEPTFIHDIQGTSYYSPILAGDGISAFNVASTTVVTVRAIVTAVDNVGPRQGYYLSEEITDWDGNSYTSEGIFVMTRNDASVGSVVSGVSVGDLVQLSANVMEYQSFSTMPRTVLVNSTGLQIISTGNALPTVTLTNMPNAVMTLVTPDYTDSSDGVGDTFDASVYALSYFETVEGMLVTIPNMVVADGFVQTSGGDPYLQAYSLDSANPGQINDRGGYTISGDPPIGPPDTATTGDDTHNGGQVLHDGDINPDIIELDFTDFATAPPTGLLQNATMGDLLGDVTGIIDFDFTDRKLFVTSMEPGGFVDAGNPVQDVTLLGDDSRSLTVATFNVENLDPTDGAARFTALANAIANNLNAPDIISIEEMQDNNGAAAGDGSSPTGTDASTTWQMLVDALNLATGAHYQWVDQAPVYNAEGGEQSGNIRVGFLYNTDRVQLGNLDANATLAERRMYTDRIGDGVRDAGDLIAFSDNMLGAEINTTDWTTTRKSLLGEFTFHGNTVYVTANHWPSKGGSGEIWQLNQNLGAGQPANSDWAQRNAVAQDVYSMLNLIESGNPNAGIVAGGDFNDFYFYRPLTTVTGYTNADGSARVGGARFENLTLTLEEAERYTYTFDGRSQAIDHIIVNSLLGDVATYDVVHLNTGYNSNGTGPNANPALSDHDPGLSSYDYRNFNELLNGTGGNDGINGFGGNDRIFTYGGNDTLFGGTGADQMTGGTGDDSYFVDNAGDQVIELAGEGYDALYTSVSYTLAAGTSIEWLSADAVFGTGAIDLTGNEIGNVVLGNQGINILDGGAGADTLVGYGGNDVYYVDNASDAIVEAAGAGFDVVYASVSYTLTVGAEVEWLSTSAAYGTGAINLTGNEYGNTILGNEGANILNGAGGADLLAGFGGNDTYFLDTAADLVAEGAGAGFDAIYTSASYVLGAGVSVEWLSADAAYGTGSINLTGNELANIILGNNGANILDGGGAGDLIYGYGGADSFAFTSAFSGDNVDLIGDFAGGVDKIWLDDAIFTALGGGLNANAFVLGTSAAGAEDRIIYNSANGQLFYDADGTGGGAQILFAVLTNHASLSASDFQVI